MRNGLVELIGSYEWSARMCCGALRNLQSYSLSLAPPLNLLNELMGRREIDEKFGALKRIRELEVKLRQAVTAGI